MRTVNQKSVCRIDDMGLIAYDEAYERQRQYVDQLILGGTPALLLCQHPPVLTLGRLADERHLLISKDEAERCAVAVRHIDRGGDITLHAPGQLVAYPILDLNRHGRDLHLFLRRLEQVAIDFLSDFDIVGNKRPGQTGVWVKDRKIASLGIGVRKWVTFHGMSVNVNTDLGLYSMIKPCGLDVRMTSMAQLTGRDLDFRQVKHKFIARFLDRFGFGPLEEE